MIEAPVRNLLHGIRARDAVYELDIEWEMARGWYRAWFEQAAPDIPGIWVFRHELPTGFVVHFGWCLPPLMEALHTFQRSEPIAFPLDLDVREG